MYLDKVFGIREFNLNSKLINAGRLYWDFVLEGTTPEGVSGDYISIFGAAFTDIPVLAPGTSNCLVHTSAAGNNIEFKIFLSDMAIEEPQNLVSSVFFRLGPENYDDFDLGIAYWYYEMNQWFTDY
jgi:hypothetical protein